MTEHLARFGAIEIPREDYRKRLRLALRAPARFPVDLPDAALRRYAGG